MLEITIPAAEFIDEKTSTFITVKEQTLLLEHSLISVAKWESKYCKAFISDEPKTVDETIYYIKCMTINKHVDPNVYLCINNDIVERVNKYIEAPMSATKFYNERQFGGGRRGETMTSELIYYYMIAGNVPVEFEKWHLNRLINLLKIISIKNDPKKNKISKRDLYSRNSAINAARKKHLHTRG